MSVSTMLSANGIDFSQSEWQNIFVQAKAENKIVFVDAYTSWCGPCKKMSREVFTNSKVGEFYNANFINVKVDMERGNGPKLAAAFAVYAYPTYLFLSPDGELLHKGMGYLQAPDFIRLGQAAVSLPNLLHVSQPVTARPNSFAIMQLSATIIMIENTSC